VAAVLVGETVVGVEELPLVEVARATPIPNRAAAPAINTV